MASTIISWLLSVMPITRFFNKFTNLRSISIVKGFLPTPWIMHLVFVLFIVLNYFICFIQFLIFSRSIEYFLEVTCILVLIVLFVIFNFSLMVKVLFFISRFILTFFRSIFFHWAFFIKFLFIYLNPSIYNYKIKFYLFILSF
jgi:hypothetical protein